MALKDYPEWVLKHKGKNIELRFIRGKYSAYKIKTVWDKEKKRSKKITLNYLGTITKEGLIPPKNRLTSLNKDDKTLKYIQLLKELEAGKEKSKLANEYGITIKTIDNIKERFDKDGVKGLIHTRENKKEETIKVSSAEELDIVTEVIKTPQKEAKEIKKHLGIKTSIRRVTNIITPIRNRLKAQKKIFLEIQIE